VNGPGKRASAPHDPMNYMRLPPEGQQQLLDDLASMLSFLAERFDGLSEDEARLRDGDVFSPVEQVWHLADLEREGFGVRIERLLNEDDAELPDFDGTAAAQRRNYREKSLREGMRAFARARQDNIDALARVTPSEWTRRGVQQGVGPISLCDIPTMMAEHDAAHRDEINAWSGSRTVNQHRHSAGHHQPGEGEARNNGRT
jgi:DinB superfamily